MSRLSLSFLLLAACLAGSVRANVPAPPPSVLPHDSVAARWEGGAELTRWLGGFSLGTQKDSSWKVVSQANWTTGLTRSLSSTGRLRHDARWLLSALKPLSKKTELWASATGQHYVDRPRNSGSLLGGQENRSSLVRGGAGPRILWNQSLSSTHSIGALNDSRENYSESGFASWHAAELLAVTSQDRHEGRASFDFEHPGNREGLEGELLYSLKQSREHASNKVELQSSWIRRSILITPAVPPQTREEKLLRVADELVYDVAGNTTLRTAGSFRYSDTRLDVHSGSASRLEELESALLAELAFQHARRELRFLSGLQVVSQNVRGEILSGRRVELGAAGMLRTGPSRLTLDCSFFKYSLDTRSDQNFDDRDELTWRLDAGARTRHSSVLTSDVQLVADLNHLVYVFSRNSANNRWTRLLLLSARFIHRPVKQFLHIPKFRISANYQAYDFETNPRQVRSTVFRKLSVGDSLAWSFRPEWTISLNAEVSREELGRLYWEAFEEERSDQTDIMAAAFEVSRKLLPLSRVGIGLAYGVRQGDRFEQNKQRTRVQDIHSWGPSARVELESSGWFCQGYAQWVLQSEIGRADREFLSGSLSAGRAW
ncbi:MAG: hypothetical protein H6508_02630 [Calditrichaeota bacterium]|nr:hypothetical protein [Calditrichota bacterium]